METKAPVRVTDDGNLEYDQWWKNGDMLLNRMGLSPKHPQSVYSLCVVHGIDPTKSRLIEILDALIGIAKAGGYDAVWFKQQTDLGTAIINKSSFHFEEYEV